jgi:YfiH family protein
MHQRHYLIPNWPAPINIKACFTMRMDGHSKPPYESFNIGNHVGDDEKAVAANRKQLITELKLPQTPFWLNQVHGTQVACADDIDSATTADAIYARKTNNPCVILTADCMPLFLCDRQGTIVALAHAGWRGLAAGVIENTITAMKIPGKNILAWMGPAMGPQKFEVGSEVREQFLATDPDATAAFMPLPNQKWLANIYLLAQQRLHNCGVTAISGGDHCTFTEKEKFFSYRRDGKQSGRMAALIWIEA